MHQPDPEAVFDAFLRNAGGDEPATDVRRPPLPPRDVADYPTQRLQRPVERERGPEPEEFVAVDPEDTGRILLLTERKKSEPAIAVLNEQVASIVPRKSEATMREEAQLAVPDIEKMQKPAPIVREGSEDGQIPAGELDRVLSDMAVLVRYGHHGQVRQHLDELTRSYPEDVLLLRRIVEFHVENHDREGALESLFLLAGRLFERRNTVGMRQALEQVLVIEPDNRRAYKLLGLLEQRPITGTGH